MTAVKAGDTVRVSVEGTVVSAAINTSEHGAIEIIRPDGVHTIYGTGPGAHMVEVIRPAYVDGGIYIDADCDVFRHTTAGFEGGPGRFLFSRMDREWGGVVRPVTWPTHPLERLDGPDSERQGNG